jgi:hypothetical protein
MKFKYHWINTTGSGHEEARDYFPIFFIIRTIQEMMTCTQLKVQASVSLDRALSPED